MYNKHKNSTQEIIYGYECNVPPIGYGVNCITGKLEKTEIIKRSAKKEDQYWERTPLPLDWAKKRKIESAKQASDPEYTDKDLDSFIEREWQRRLCGVWFYNNGVPTYITGTHYFYLNWWKIDVGYPAYRNPDRKFFYVWKYCEEDPRCCGLVEATKRRQGKTYRGGCIIFEYCSRTMEATGGAQSKTNDDAKKQVFQKAIIHPFKNLPDFWIPVFDTSKGLTPTSELRFIKTTKKGKRALEDIDKPELNSVIDYRSSEEFGYDGYKLHRYFRDEAGKTMEADVYKSHQVVRFCLENDGAWIGRALYSTTVEEMESGGANFKKLWLDSDQNVRDANGHTQSGMYRYFTPAYETLNFDRYGFPDIEKSKEYYLNQRAGLANNNFALSSIKRKSPFTEHEMFYIDGEKCLFNSEKLNEQLDWLSWHTDIIERGNFEWKDGVRFSEVIWVKSNSSGRWQMPLSFKMEEPNKVTKINDRFFPNNNINFRIGCDPFKYNKVKDNRRSDCAAFAGKMFDPSKPSDLFNDAFCCRYRFRAATTALSNEDILKMAWYFGCQILFERNVDHWRAYFIENGCEGFLMKLPDEDDYGIYSDGHGNMLQSICDCIEDHVENNCKRILFKSTIEEYLEFDIGNTTKYDETIASGITRVAMKRKIYRKQSDSGRDVGEYFRSYTIQPPMN